MQKKYCLIPDEEKFFGFLASLSVFTKVELMRSFLRVVSVKMTVQCVKEFVMDYLHLVL